MFFLLLPVGVDYKASRWPVVTFSLMGACVLVHIWSIALWSMGVESYVWWMKSFWFTPSAANLLTIFTSLFVHADIFHLLGNMVYLFLFGASTEDIIGRGRFLTLYLVGGVASVFAHVALTSGHFASDVPLGGASGAISACMGAFLLLLPKTKIEFKFFGWFFFRPISRDFFVSAWIVMSFWFLSDLLWAVLELAKVAENEGTAFGAHLGGFALGMGALGLLKLWWRSHPRDNPLEEPAPEPVRARVVRHTTPERPYLISQNNEEYGPYSQEEILQYLADGSIIPEAHFWREGDPEWQPVSQLPTPAL